MSVNPEATFTSQKSDSTEVIPLSDMPSTLENVRERIAEVCLELTDKTLWTVDNSYEQNTSEIQQRMVKLGRLRDIHDLLQGTTRLEVPDSSDIDKADEIFEEIDKNSPYNVLDEEACRLTSGSRAGSPTHDRSVYRDMKYLYNSAAQLD